MQKQEKYNYMYAMHVDSVSLVSCLISGHTRQLNREYGRPSTQKANRADLYACEEHT